MEETALRPLLLPVPLGVGPIPIRRNFANATEIDEQFGSSSELPQDKKKENGAMLNIGIANLHNGTFVGFNEKFKTRDLVKALKVAVPVPIDIHSHYTSGMAGMTYLKAIEAHERS